MIEDVIGHRKRIAEEKALNSNYPASEGCRC
jgi:hypothetical protein